MTSDELQVERPAQGVQSVETGFAVLAALARAGRPSGLKELADAVGMSSPKVHRYLVSLMRAGAVEQDPANGRYDLGQVTLELGLAALGRLDGMREGLEALDALRARIDETVCLVVWGNHGPTVVGWEQATRSVAVNIRAGSVLSLLRSASGLVFAAFLPAAETADVMASEARELRLARSQVRARLEEVRRRGLATVEGTMLPGVSAIAAPVFDHRGRLVYTLTALGPSTGFDADPDGPVGTVLRSVAGALSERLGYGGPKAL